jgi:hypothetical protein
MMLIRALSTSIHRGYSYRYITCLAIAAVSFSAAARGASINYGNFNLPGIMFQGVTESSGTDTVPLYGPPTPFTIGLDFDPMSFMSSSTGGVADVTDGQLNFTVMSLPGGPSIDGINLFEAGDYSLAGAGGPPTSVFAGAILRATILAIDGVAVAPMNLAPVNGSIGDSLPGVMIASPWSLGLSDNIASALGPGQHATKVAVVINNTLLSTSEAGTVAFISKKDFRIGITPGPQVPEPAALVLATLAVCGALGFARTRQ